MQKSIIKYMLNDSKISVIIFSGVIIMIMLLVLTSSVSFITVNEVSVNGLGFSAMVFLFVGVLSTLPMGIRYMNQSGFSRKTAYLNYIVSFTIVAFFVSVLIQLLVVITRLFLGENVVLGTEYEILFKDSSSASILPSIIWLFLAVVAITSIGFFISLFYQKIENKTKVFVSTGFPIFFMLILPLIDVFFFDGVIYAAIWKGFIFICGFYNGNAYPLLSMGMLTFVAIVFYVITYFTLVRKLNFK